MRLTDVIVTAVGEILANKLRSFFTLLGLIVSVAFLVAVVAVIQGMNSYVKENVAASLIGTNAFQVRRVPIQIGIFDDEMWKKVNNLRADIGVPNWRQRLTSPTTGPSLLMNATSDAISRSLRSSFGIRAVVVLDFESGLLSGSARNFAT